MTSSTMLSRLSSASPPCMPSSSPIAPSSQRQTSIGARSTSMLAVFRTPSLGPLRCVQRPEWNSCHFCQFHILLPSAFCHALFSTVITVIKTAEEYGEVHLLSRRMFRLRTEILAIATEPKN